MSTLPIVLALAAAQGGDISRYYQPNLQDASFVARVVKADQNELSKINDDFGQAYRFGTTNIHVKEPFMVRVDAKSDDTNVVFIVNGPIQLMKVPRAGFHQRTDLSKKPGRRQTLFDFGVLTSSLFDSLYSAKFVRTDRATGDPVYDITYQANDLSRSRIWIDSAHHVIAKREWYNQKGQQLATFFYENPEEVDGIWLPTKVEVKNVDDVVAAVTNYTTVKVNTGLSDDLFSTH